MKPLASGDLIAQKYRLERVVGRGGMGSVWAARNEQLGMLVALKFIDADAAAGDADARARFEREAKAAAQIRSPHVAQIIDHGVDGDRPFIAMELLEGEDLGERLRREGRLSLPAVSRILSQAAKALRRAHEAGIIHRDLKPGNIFLARFDDDEIVKLLDFGVAKVRASGALEAPLATRTGVVFGSPSYMSPEQARGQRNLDHRSDLWSLAVIVFRAITGVKPFQAASIGDLVVKLCIDPIPVATSFAPELPPEVDRFFERAFARDPDKRFASAVEMAAAFEAIASLAPAASAAPISSSAPPVPRPAPAAPLSQPAVAPALPPSPSRPPAPGSGPHVAFAPGTLTPPPGSTPEVQPIPSPGFAAIAGPPSSGVPALWPLPAEPAPRPAGPSRRIVVAAALGAAALSLLVVVLLVGVRSGRGVASVHAAASAAAPAPPPPADPPAASAPAQPSAEPSAQPSAEPSAQPSAEPSAQPSAEPSAQPSAEPDPSPKPSAAPRAPTKPGKKRPNFGY